MTFTTFLILFSVCAILVGLLTEALKKAFNWSGRLTALAVSVVVPALVILGYCVFAPAEFTIKFALGTLFLMIASWLGATLGFDTIKAAIQEIINIFGDKK